MSKKCSYCNENYQKNTEHVFPSGLGGQDLYMSCVCEKCNNIFSSLERELYQKSPVAFMRSIEGVKLEKNKSAFFKAEILLHFDKETGIVYEMGQFNELNIFIRPQIVKLNGTFYIEGSTSESNEVFVTKFRKWRESNLKLIVKIPKTKDDMAGILIFEKSENSFGTTLIEDRLKIKNEITIDLLQPSHELYNHLSPRLFINDEKYLKIRAKSTDDAIDFLLDFMNYTLLNNTLSSIGTERKLINPEIFVGLNFNFLKAEQALVKIGLNCLIHYIPNIKDNALLENIISFVLTGNPKIISNFVEKSELIDSQKDSHCIFFAQMDKSMNIRVSLFNGSLAYNFSIPGLIVLKPNEYNRLVVKYKERINKFENGIDFFKSFDVNL